MQPEQPTVMIAFSPELVDRLKDWSGPVEMRIVQGAAGGYDAEVRTHRCSADNQLPYDGEPS